LKRFRYLLTVSWDRTFSLWFKTICKQQQESSDIYWFAKKIVLPFL